MTLSKSVNLLGSIDVLKLYAFKSIIITLAKRSFIKVRANMFNNKVISSYMAVFMIWIKFVDFEKINLY